MTKEFFWGGGKAKLPWHIKWQEATIEKNGERYRADVQIPVAEDCAALAISIFPYILNFFDALDDCISQIFCIFHCIIFSQRNA